jgi:hypothetical protein
MMPYERWKAWEVSHRLVLTVYRETRSWPTEERYGLIGRWASLNSLRDSAGKLVYGLARALSKPPG